MREISARKRVKTEVKKVNTRLSSEQFVSKKWQKSVQKSVSKSVKKWTQTYACI